MEQKLASRTILSVWPANMTADRFHTHQDSAGRQIGGMLRYVLIGAPKGEYRTLKVFDCYQFERDWAQEEEAYIPRFIPCDVVADDLYREWAMNRIGGNKGFLPGVIVCEGEEPTAAEKSKADKLQSNYFQWLVDDGTTMFSRGDLNGITDLHRVAAKWLGIDLPWVKSYDERVKFVECPHCFSQIDSRASVCKICLREVKASAPPPMIEPERITASRSKP